MAAPNTVHRNRTSREASLPLLTVRGCMLVAGVALTWILAGQLPGSSSKAHAEDALPLRACGQWDSAATEALVTLVRGKQDGQLRQISDVVFRMRRARRNCEAGWVRLACQDYRAIIQATPGFIHGPAAAILCPSISLTSTAVASTAINASAPSVLQDASPSPSARLRDCSEIPPHPPLDGAMGNAGGDPHAYYIFNREEGLAIAKQAVDACALAAFAFAQ